MRLVTFLAMFALLAVARPAAADFMITVSGSYKSGFNDGTGGWFDGTTYRDLPPLLDLDRLQGGSFTASFVIPDSATAPKPGTGFAINNVPASANITYTLFDAAGAVVHRGLNPSDAFIEVANNVSSGANSVDRVGFSWFANHVTGATPPPQLYGGGGLYADQTTFAWQQNGPPSDILTDLSVPLNPDTYGRFANGFFSTGLLFLDGDTDNFSDPYQYVETDVSYAITGVSIQIVPEPGSLTLMVCAGVPGAAAWLLRRRKRGSSSGASRPSRLPIVAKALARVAASIVGILVVATSASAGMVFQTVSSLLPGGSGVNQMNVS